MKIRVQRPAGTMETITLVPPVTVRLGRGLNRLTEASGRDHFFTLDGYYDGWCGAVLVEEDAMEVIQRVEESRER